MIEDVGAMKAMHQRRLTRATELLVGLITGLVADGELSDAEIRFLKAWLDDHADVTDTWPGSAIAAQINTSLHDGIISSDERRNLLNVLLQVAGTDFSATGSTAAEVAQLPVEPDHTPLNLAGAVVCFTGEFLYGTRAACERLTERVGGMAATNVSRKVNLLVVGTNASPDWQHTSFGRKIQQVMEMREAGHPIRILTEQHWLASVESTAGFSR